MALAPNLALTLIVTLALTLTLTRRCQQKLPRLAWVGKRSGDA